MVSFADSRPCICQPEIFKLSMWWHGLSQHLDGKKNHMRWCFCHKRILNTLMPSNFEFASLLSRGDTGSWRDGVPSFQSLVHAKSCTTFWASRSEIGKNCGPREWRLPMPTWLPCEYSRPTWQFGVAVLAVWWPTWHRPSATCDIQYSGNTGSNEALFRLPPCYCARSTFILMSALQVWERKTCKLLGGNTKSQAFNWRTPNWLVSESLSSENGPSQLPPNYAQLNWYTQ